MNKYLAILVGILVAGNFAFAQHTNTVDQIGSDNNSSVVQGFDGSGTSYDGNEADVDQIGDDNKSLVEQQNNGYAGSSEYATTYQEGNRNYANTYQWNDGHTGNQYQYGNDNEGRMSQYGNKNAGEIFQDGHRNNANTFDFGVMDVTFATSIGNDNKIDQDLGATGVGASSYSFVITEQFGNDNKSRQMIEGNGYPGGILAEGNVLEVLQDGNDNQSKQEVLVNSPNEYNLLTNDQLGHRNWNHQRAQGSYNELDALQEGNDNWSKQFATEDGNSSIVYQNGNDNSSVSLQN